MVLQLAPQPAGSSQPRQAHHARYVGQSALPGGSVFFDLFLRGEGTASPVTLVHEVCLRACMCVCGGGGGNSSVAWKFILQDSGKAFLPLQWTANRGIRIRRFFKVGNVRLGLCTCICVRAFSVLGKVFIIYRLKRLIFKLHI